MFQGWKALPQRFDDPAHSGGNLDRPALKQLLREIELGRIDVVVVYKIDALPDPWEILLNWSRRSMPSRCPLSPSHSSSIRPRPWDACDPQRAPVLCSVEGELAAERVKDKIAASRRKGKWPGGTVPFGYDAKDKKLAMNKVEAETVRAIFRLYLEHKSFGILVGELDRRKMVTKRRNVSNPKCKGGIPFTYGPLAYFLKNRIYVGEVRYGEKWFKGEHAAILNRQTFERVQDLLKSNRVIRRIKHSESGALLQDKLFDDKGNRMGPSFSSKNGVRYRFYVSTALRGRKQQAGTITQDSAPEIERIVEEALHREINEQGAGATTVWDIIDRVVVRLKSIVVTPRSNTDERPVETIEIPWASKTPDRCNTPISSSNCAPIESWSKLLFARTLGCPS